MGNSKALLVLVALSLLGMPSVWADDSQKPAHGSEENAKKHTFDNFYLAPGMTYHSVKLDPKLGQVDLTKYVDGNLTLGGYTLTVGDNLITGDKFRADLERTGKYSVSDDFDIKFTAGNGVARRTVGLSIYTQAAGDLAGNSKEKLKVLATGIKFEPVGLAIIKNKTVVFASVYGRAGYRYEDGNNSIDLAAGAKLAAMVGPIVAISAGAEYVEHVYIGDIPGMAAKYDEAFNKYSDATNKLVKDCPKGLARAGEAAAKELMQTGDDAAATIAAVESGKRPAGLSDGSDASQKIADAQKACEDAAKQKDDLSKQADKDQKDLFDTKKIFKTVSGWNAYADIAVFPTRYLYIGAYGGLSKDSMPDFDETLKIITTPRTDFRIMGGAGVALPH